MKVILRSMADFLAVLVIVGGIGFILWLAYVGFIMNGSVRHSNEAQESPSPIQVQPQTLTKTLSFMPGQFTNIPNRRFRKIEIHSEYPIRVLTGPCHENYAVQFLCESDPADIFITDMRPRPIFLTPRANTVTITASDD